MPEKDAVLEPQADADEALGTEYVDKSIDTSIPVPEVEAEAPVVEAEPEIEADPSPAVDDNDEEKTPAFEHERTTEVIKKWRETERENEALHSQNQELRKQIEEQAVSAPEDLKAPEDFATPEEYQGYLKGEMKSIATTAATDAVNSFKAESRTEEIESDFETREKAFAKDMPDYYDLVYDKGLRISAAMKDVIQSEEHGLELAVYLGSNPDIAKDIHAMSETSEVKAGMALSGILADIKAAKVKVETPEVTKAPPPVPAIPAGDEGLERGFHEGMSNKDFNKMRRKQIASR